MIRLPRFNEKNHFECEKSKIAPRKSYSPNRNYSEGMKKTNPNNVSFILTIVLESVHQNYQIHRIQISYLKKSKVQQA